MKRSLVLALTATLGGGAFAQTQNDYTRDHHIRQDGQRMEQRFERTDRFDRTDRFQRDMAMQGQMQRLSQLVGATVVDNRGQRIGQIENCAIDTEIGQVTYCIVSVDGRNVAVPWQALDVRGTGTQIDRVTLNVDRERLRNAPTVQRDRLNVLADERFTRDVHQFYGAQPNQIRTERFEYRDTQRWEDTRPDRRDFDRRLELHDQRDFDARYEGRYDARIDAREGRARFEAQHDPSLRSPGERDVRYRETWDVRDRRFEDHHDPRMRTPGTFREDQYRDTRTYDREWEVRRDYDTRWDDTQWNRRTWRDDRWVDDPRIARPGEAHPGGYGGGIMDDRTWDRRDRDLAWRERDWRDREVVTRDRDVDRLERRDVQYRETVTMDRRIVGARTLLNANARGAERENLGSIEDVLVDANTGRINFVVLSTGGILGIGQRLHAVPFEAVQIHRFDAERQELALDVSQRQLRDAPSFRRGDWEMVLRDPGTMQETYAYYGVRDRGFAYGYVPPQRDFETRRDFDRRDQRFDDRQQRDQRWQDTRRDTMMLRDTLTPDQVDNVIRNWPQPSQRAAREMLQRYGRPNGVTDDVIYWVDNGQWAHTIVHREPIQREFPVRQNDVLEQTVYYRVPADRMNDLARFSGSIMTYRTGGWLTSRSESEAMNILTLNCAHGIITGRHSVEEAQRMYTEGARDHQRGESSPMFQQLQFQPQSQREAADPGRELGRDREQPRDRDRERDRTRN